MRDGQGEKRAEQDGERKLPDAVKERWSGESHEGPAGKASASRGQVETGERLRARFGASELAMTDETAGQEDERVEIDLEKDRDAKRAREDITENRESESQRNERCESRPRPGSKTKDEREEIHPECQDPEEGNRGDILSDLIVGGGKKHRRGGGQAEPEKR